MCVWGASRRSACEESVHELVQQPARPHHFCVSRSYPIGESPVRRDHDRATMRLGDGDDRVVTLAPCVHNLNAVHVALVDARPGSALEYECHRRVEPSRGHGRPHSFSKASCRAGPITPPAGWPRPDHVGGINHEHPNSVAPSRLAGSPALSTKRRIDSNRWAIGCLPREWSDDDDVADLGALEAPVVDLLDLRVVVEAGNRAEWPKVFNVSARSPRLEHVADTAEHVRRVRQALTLSACQ